MTASPQTSSPDALIALASELAHELHPARRKGHYNLQSSLDRDLGLDSLSRAELLLRIERTLGRALPENAAVTAETLGDLWLELERSPSAASPRPTARPQHRAAETEQLALPDDAHCLADVLHVPVYS